MSLFLNLLFETDSYSNEYLLTKFGVDTAENEPLKVCQKLPRDRKKRFKNIVEDRAAEEAGHNDDAHGEDVAVPLVDAGVLDEELRPVLAEVVFIAG